MKPYDASGVRATSGTVQWSCVFDPHESRIYRTQNGMERMADIELSENKLMDLDELAERIRLRLFFSLK